MLHVPTRARPLTYSILRGNDLADHTEGVRKQRAPPLRLHVLGPATGTEIHVRSPLAALWLGREEALRRVPSSHRPVWVSLTGRSLGGQDGWQ
jgi:hypothetical protein